MSWSIGEVAALCTKAARGAGAPWAIAEEYGAAVRWLARADLPAAEIAAAVISREAHACPLELGLRIADARDPALAAAAGIVAEPAMLLPFLARTLGDGRTLRLDLAGSVVHVSATGTDLDHRPGPGRIGAIAEAAIRLAPGTQWRVGEIAPETLARLSALAACTYAPASEHSRLTGAGAGLIDAD